MLPEIGDQKGAVGPRDGALETRRVVGVAGHDIRPRRGQRTRLVGIGLARDRTHREPPFGVGENGTHKAPALRSGGSDDGDGLLRWHVWISFSRNRHAGRRCHAAVRRGWSLIKSGSVPGRTASF